MTEFTNKLVDLATNAGGKLILAIVVFIVGSIVIKALKKDSTSWIRFPSSTKQSRASSRT